MPEWRSGQFINGGNAPSHPQFKDSSTGREVRAQIAITRNGITKASSDKAPPEGGVLARGKQRFPDLPSEHVSETALVQMMRSLRARPRIEMSLEMAGDVTRHLSRQDACLRLALRALGILERVNEPLFMSNLELYDRKRPPVGVRSQNLLRPAELDLVDEMLRRRFSKSAPPRSNRLGRAESMRLYFLACPRNGLAGGSACRHPLDEGFNTPGRRWLFVIYERPLRSGPRCIITALSGSTRAPWGPFQRFVYPITPQNERPAISGSCPQPRSAKART